MQNITQWNTLLIPYEQAVSELKVKLRSIRKECAILGEYCPIEFITGRVKKISSIIQKANKKGISINDIEKFIDDIAGIRIMCQFSDDIYKVVELIRQRNGMDLTIMYEKDYVKHTKSSGYRSYHIIIRYPINTTTGTKNILAEIQIRTLAMNFWATIEHSLNYKYGAKMPTKIQERLQSTARAAYKLDEEMLDIRQEIVNAQLMFQFESSAIDAITNMIKKLHSSGKTDKAIYYNNILEEIYEFGNYNRLESLYKEITKELN